MAALTHVEWMNFLRREYELTQEAHYSRFFYSRASSWDLFHKGFAGSSKEIFFETDESAYLSRGSCLAAPEIHVAAAKRIALGVSTTRLPVKPLRLYATEVVSFEADSLYVGDVHFLKVPSRIEIVSRRVVFCRTGRENPHTFDILNQWIDHDATQVERVVIP